jgi:hypothetical protein
MRGGRRNRFRRAALKEPALPKPKARKKPAPPKPATRKKPALPKPVARKKPAPPKPIARKRPTVTKKKAAPKRATPKRATPKKAVPKAIRSRGEPKLPLPTPKPAPVVRAKPKPKPAPVVRAKPKPPPPPPPKPVVRAKPAPVVGAKPKPVVRAKPAPVVRAKPKPKPKPKPVAKAKPKAKPKAKRATPKATRGRGEPNIPLPPISLPKPKPKPKPVAKAKPKPKPKPVAKAKPKPPPPPDVRIDTEFLFGGREPLDITPQLEAALSLPKPKPKPKPAPTKGKVTRGPRLEAPPPPPRIRITEETPKIEDAAKRILPPPPPGDRFEAEAVRKIIEDLPARVTKQLPPSPPVRVTSEAPKVAAPDKAKIQKVLKDLEKKVLSPDFRTPTRDEIAEAVTKATGGRYTPPTSKVAEPPPPKAEPVVPSKGTKLFGKEIDPNASELDKLKKRYNILKDERFITDPGPEYFQGLKKLEEQIMALDPNFVGEFSSSRTISEPTKVDIPGAGQVTLPTKPSLPEGVPSGGRFYDHPVTGDPMYQPPMPKRSEGGFGIQAFPRPINLRTGKQDDTRLPSSPTPTPRPVEPVFETTPTPAPTPAPAPAPTPAPTPAPAPTPTPTPAPAPPAPPSAAELNAARQAFLQAMDPLQGVRETYVPTNILGQSFDPGVREDYARRMMQAGANVQQGGSPTFQVPTSAVPQVQFGGYGAPVPMAPLAPYAGLGGPLPPPPPPQLASGAVVNPGTGEVEPIGYVPPSIIQGPIT